MIQNLNYYCIFYIQVTIEMVGKDGRRVEIVMMQDEVKMKRNGNTMTFKPGDYPESKVSVLEGSDIEVFKVIH